MSSSKFDDLLTELGTGKWNVLYFLTSSFWSLMLPPQFISGVYLAPSVNFTCRPPEDENVTTISEDSCRYLVSSSSSAKPQEKMCAEFDFDTSVFSSTLTSEFSLVCDREYMRASYQSIYMLGTFLSPLLGGYLADRYGRKVVVVVTEIIFTLTSLGLCLLTNFTAILIVRFFMGSVNLLTCFILAMEVCEPKHRGTVGILIGLPWALGTMAWGGVAYLIRDWRWLQLAVSLPNLLIFLPLFFLDESPRWLIVRGYHERALRALRKAARWNNASLPPEEELRGLMMDIQEESSTAAKKTDSVKQAGARSRKCGFLTVPNLLRIGTMSKLPTPDSRLRFQPSRLKLPGSSMKRQASATNMNSSPEKKVKLGSSGSFNDSEDSFQDIRPPVRRGTSQPGVAAAGKLRRSRSMANLPAVGQRNRNTSKTAFSLSKMGASTLNLAGRPSNISAATITQSRVPSGGIAGRRPGTNITNRISNTQTSGNTKGSISANKPAPGVNNVNGDALSKGKPKRAAWDLKGRLQDMENLVKTSTVERENFLVKLASYDTRIENLEVEKQNLNQNLQKTQTVSQANQEEVERLANDLRVEHDDRLADKRRYENTIQDLEFKKSSLERQIKSLEAELASRQDEVAGLKSTVSHLTSAHAGIEAQLSSTKLLLDDRNNRVSDLEAEVAQWKETGEELEQKLHEGENARRKLHNQVQELKGNIRVFCRVRPLIGDEIKNNGDSDVIHHINFIDDRSLEINKCGDPNGSSMSGLKGRGNGNIEFSYDRVFSPSETQADVFEEISQLAQSALDGYNVCVFAYGQTGSGKTFTMEGHGIEDLEGMIPRTVRHIFANMKELEDKGWTYKVEASFLEIYNETIRDLLSSPKESKNLTYEIKMIDSKKNDTYVSNLKVVQVLDENKVHSLLHLAQQQRAVAATNVNERSSRSHSVFRLKLTGVNNITSESCEGTLNLVDLAGSERLKESGSEGARLTETQNINKSLSNLGNVIMALAQKQSHVPYRNSKLTHLLQNCVGGNSKTLMLVNVSPSEMCFNETLNSLRFATKVNQCHIGTATKQVRK